MRLEELINKNYQNLNDNDHYIWDYISSHRKECENLSIDELAQRCHVSRTTILRFSKRLGLKGYTELKVYLRLDNSQRQYKENGLENIYNSYRSYMDIVKDKDMSHVVSLLMQADRIYAYGTGSIQNHVVAEIKRSFLEIGKLIFAIESTNDTYVFEDIITSQDVIIVVSYSGENQTMLNFVKKLKLRNVPIIAITAKKNNTLSQIADESLYVEVASIYNPLGPRHDGLVNYYILIDFILVKYIDQYERMSSQ